MATTFFFQLLPFEDRRAIDEDLRTISSITGAISTSVQCERVPYRRSMVAIYLFLSVSPAFVLSPPSLPLPGSRSVARQLRSDFVMHFSARLALRYCSLFFYFPPLVLICTIFSHATPQLTVCMHQQLSYFTLLYPVFLPSSPFLRGR